MNPTLRPSKVVETGVYVKDLERAQRFYGDVLSLELYTRQEGRHVFFKAGKSTLLRSMRTLHSRRSKPPTELRAANTLPSKLTNLTSTLDVSGSGRKKWP